MRAIAVRAGRDLDRACVHVDPATTSPTWPIRGATAVIVATSAPAAPEGPRKAAAAVARATCVKAGVSRLVPSSAMIDLLFYHGVRMRFRACMP